jgi:hypothetical protein
LITALYIVSARSTILSRDDFPTAYIISIRETLLPCVLEETRHDIHKPVLQHDSLITCRYEAKFIILRRVSRLLTV